MLTRQQQGDLGEASALEWLASKGAGLFVPFGCSPDYDLIAELDGRLCRVQVKTSRCRTPNGTRSYAVQLETRGGNQSWSGTSKGTIAVGGVSYCDYEVEPGRPFAEDAQ